VQRILSVALVISSFWLCAGCGNTFFGGAIQPGVSTVTGLVTVIELTVVDGTTQVTFVTFLENGVSSTFAFCGDQRNRFPMDEDVRTKFNPGQPCASVVTIVII
jgi:hypothetical protein